jgi:hypothetical protein
VMLKREDAKARRPDAKIGATLVGLLSWRTVQ